MGRRRQEASQVRGERGNRWSKEEDVEKRKKGGKEQNIVKAVPRFQVLLFPFFLRHGEEAGGPAEQRGFCAVGASSH